MTNWGSAETVVRGVGNRYPEMAIRYVASEPGAALQRNVGIDLARCDVVVFIDDDCTVEPGLFEVLALLGKERTISRLQALVEFLRARS